MLVSVNIYKLDGSVDSRMELPKVFETAYRPRIVRRAVLVAESSRIQAKGPSHSAGRKTTAEYVGRRGSPNALINKGVARKPRTKNRRRLIEGSVKGIPGVVGGPRAHPPKPFSNAKECMNRKERLLALRSAISMLKDRDIVMKRGHKLSKDLTLPVVCVNDLEKLSKTKDVFQFLEKVGLDKDVYRAKDRKKIRAGKGKNRGRKYKRAKSVLFVVSKDNLNIHKAARNLEGVNVVSVRNVSVRDLAPGGAVGRLTVFSKDAMDALKNRF